MVNNIETLSIVKVEYFKDLYKIVDLLNRTLKKEYPMYGMAWDESDENQAVFTIYCA
ncbi:DUF4264 domain-containing protein [Virgibacillus dakarensis]|nr:MULTISPECIES: DUF4264 family protein [Bacillaceae]MBT2214239.1 DUF4264 family protein [Virgibacillus dakarensis]MTW85936.1 DUF4264 domain-containing protein [Virgibacillus dakarensis]